MPTSYLKETWQKALSDMVTDPNELFQLLELDPALLLEGDFFASDDFKLKVPRSFIARMEKGNPNDPLLKQILPLGVELDSLLNYSDKDPLNENNVNPVPGLLHKYHGRVLVTLTSACAVHCRYCFRRYFPYDHNNPSKQGIRAILDYIAADPSIHEVILSGGDPLSVNDTLLQFLTEALSKLQQIKRLRIHTRFPIVIPQRITPSFVEALKLKSFEVIMVVHVNHPQEISEEVSQALLLLREAGVFLFNQSVLLKGINDEVNTLKLLSETLFKAGVIPYYLHLLDKVKGAAHFDLEMATARAIYAELTHLLPGYLVPKLVYEEPGKKAKTMLV